LRPRVPAERAVHRDEAVAAELAADLAGERRGDRVALHAVGQRQRVARVGAVREAVATLPVLVQDAAVAHVRDAGAADLAQPRTRSAVRVEAEQSVDPAAAPFERRSVVRRAEADELTKLAAPPVARLL